MVENVICQIPKQKVELPFKLLPPPKETKTEETNQEKVNQEGEPKTNANPLKTAGAISTGLAAASNLLFATGAAKACSVLPEYLSPNFFVGTIFGMNYGGGILTLNGLIKAAQVLRKKTSLTVGDAAYLLNGTMDLAAGFATMAALFKPKEAAIAFALAKLMQLGLSGNPSKEIQEENQKEQSKCILETLLKGYGNGIKEEFEKKLKAIKENGFPSNGEIYKETVEEVKKTPNAGSAALGAAMANVGIKSFLTPFLKIAGPIIAAFPIIGIDTMLGLHLGSKNPTPERDELGAQVLGGVVVSNHAPVKALAEALIKVGILDDPKGDGLRSKMARGMVAGVDAIFKGVVGRIAKVVAEHNPVKAGNSKGKWLALAGAALAAGIAIAGAQFLPLKEYMPANPDLIWKTFAVFDIGWIGLGPLFGSYMAGESKEKIKELAKKLTPVVASNLSIMFSSVLLAKAVVEQSAPEAGLALLGYLAAYGGYKYIWGNRGAETKETQSKPEVPSLIEAKVEEA